MVSNTAAPRSARRSATISMAIPLDRSRSSAAIDGRLRRMHAHPADLLDLKLLERAEHQPCSASGSTASSRRMTRRAIAIASLTMSASASRAQSARIAGQRSLDAAASRSSTGWSSARGAASARRLALPQPGCARLRARDAATRAPAAPKSTSRLRLASFLRRRVGSGGLGDGSPPRHGRRSDAASSGRQQPRRHTALRPPPSADARPRLPAAARPR